MTLVSTLLALFTTGCTTTRLLPTAAHVDLRRYSGKWFEMARLPNRFQQDDARAIAEYTPRPDGSIAVRNTEQRPDGTTKVVEGRATPVQGSEGARLRVHFGGLAALIPVSSMGNYWIIALEPDYSLALVGTPNRKFLWLLARKPQVTPSRLERYLGHAKDLGFQTSRLLHFSW